MIFKYAMQLRKFGKKTVGDDFMEKMEREGLKVDWETQHYMDLPEMKIYEAVEEADSRFCNCFHYTSMEKFWSMVGSDLMYARNVCFSNDSEEYKLGKRIIDKLLKFSNEENQDLYMICFCTERDLLSQWREYGKGGVCLGFDLSGEDYYTILNNAQTEKKNTGNSAFKGFEKYAIPEHAGYGESKCIYLYAKLLKVFYIGKKYKKIKKKYKMIDQRLVSSELHRDKYMRYMIPYIKHEGFREEAEARLVFNIEPENMEYQVNYLEEDGIKKPYIKVEFGEIEEKQADDCEIIADHIEEFSAEFGREIQKINKILNINISVRTVNKHSRGQIIIGCSAKQKEIFERIDHLVQSWNFKKTDKKIKVWCKGHLPIREITIGPSLNKKEIKEGILHYIQNVYWLKYVDVRCTDIPYRDKRIRME